MKAIQTETLPDGLPENVKNEISASRAEMAKNALILNPTIVVRTIADQTSALEILTALKAYYKSKEDRRKEIVDPINKGVKLINAEFKKITDRISEVISGIESALFSFRQAEAKRIADANAKEMARIAKEAAKAEAKFDKTIKGTRGDTRAVLEAQKESAVANIEAKAEIKTQEKTIDGTSFKKIVDREKINTAITKADGKIEIAGVRIFKVWDFEILDAKSVPEEYKKESLSTRY